MSAAHRRVTVIRRSEGGGTRRPDDVAVEEPLEIRLVWPAHGLLVERVLTVTMRTPGADPALAAGLLVAEGVLRDREDLVTLEGCGPIQPDGSQNVIRARLRGPPAHLDAATRVMPTTSACGVCGKASLDALALRGPPALTAWCPSDALIRALPGRLRAAQTTFTLTGGLHGAGLYDPASDTLTTFEDVGRHNAVDKVIGAAWLNQSLPRQGAALVVSGRASFELVQKAVMAGVSSLIAVGAPSSLAVALATAHGLALYGFCRPSGYNVYAGPDLDSIVENKAHSTPPPSAP